MSDSSVENISFLGLLTGSTIMLPGIYTYHAFSLSPVETVTLISVVCSLVFLSGSFFKLLSLPERYNLLFSLVPIFWFYYWFFLKHEKILGLMPIPILISASMLSALYIKINKNE